jgi:hypothetical protein
VIPPYFIKKIEEFDFINGKVTPRLEDLPPSRIVTILNEQSEDQMPSQEEWKIFFEIFSKSLNVEIEGGEVIKEAISIRQTLIPTSFPERKGEDPAVIVKCSFSPQLKLARERNAIILSRKEEEEGGGGRWKYSLYTQAFPSQNEVIENVYVFCNVNETATSEIIVDSIKHAGHKYSVGFNDYSPIFKIISEREGCFSGGGKAAIKVVFTPTQYGVHKTHLTITASNKEWNYKIIGFFPVFFLFLSFSFLFSLSFSFRRCFLVWVLLGFFFLFYFLLLSLFYFIFIYFILFYFNGNYSLFA